MALAWVLVERQPSSWLSRLGGKSTIGTPKFAHILSAIGCTLQHFTFSQDLAWTSKTLQFTRFYSIMAFPLQNVAKIQRQILEASRHRFQLNRKSFLEIEMFYEKEKTVFNVAVYNMIVSTPCRFGDFFLAKPSLTNIWAVYVRAYSMRW